MASKELVQVMTRDEEISKLISVLKNLELRNSIPADSCIVAARIGAVAGSVGAGKTLKAGHTGAVGNAMNADTIVRAAKSFGKMGDDLCALNVNRGGTYGTKGFVAENMEAAEATFAGKNTYVLDDNGVADLVHVGKNGHKYYKQMKFGKSYNARTVDFEKYRGQTVIVDKGNPNFASIRAEGKKYGVNVVESSVSVDEAQAIAEWSKIETGITGAKNATVVPRVAAAHRAGLNAGKTGALYGAGFSLATNAVDVAKGDKELGEAAIDVAVDTAVSYGVGYAAGAVGSAVASTSAGAAVIGAASSVGSAVAGTAVGGAVIGAAGATTAAIGGAAATAVGTTVAAAGTAGAAVGSAAAAVTSAVAGSAAGAAVASGVAAVGAGAAAVGAAAVAAAPVLAVGAAVGLIFKGFSSLFDD